MPKIGYYKFIDVANNWVHLYKLTSETALHVNSTTGTISIVAIDLMPVKAMIECSKDEFTSTIQAVFNVINDFIKTEIN